MLERLDLDGNVTISAAGADALMMDAQRSALKHLKIDQEHVIHPKDEEWITSVTLPHLRWGDERA